MLIRILSAFICIMMLQGCVVNGDVSSIAEYQTNKDRIGLVVVSITKNTNAWPYVGGITLTRIKKDDEATTEKYQLHNQVDWTQSSTYLYFGGLPSGEYQISQITGENRYIPFRDTGLTGTIIIKAGEVNDLGRLIFTRVQSGYLLGRSKSITDNTALLKYFFSNKPELIKQHQRSAWKLPHLESDQTEKFALQHPAGISAFTELKDGRIIAGTSLGTTLIRTLEEKWQFFSRNKNLNQITATAAYEQGTNLVVAGDEYGNLYQIAESGDSTPLNSGNLPDGRVVFISSNKEYNQWYVAIDNGYHSELYRSKSIDNGTWELQKSSEFMFSSPGGEGRGGSVWYWKRPNGIGYASAAAPEVSCLSYKNNRWETNPTPESLLVYGITTSAANNAISLFASEGGAFYGMNSKKFITTDCGSSWTEIASFNDIKNTRPLMVKDDLIIESSGYFSDQGIHGSNDNGKTWHNRSKSDDYKGSLWLSKRNELFSIRVIQNGYIQDRSKRIESSKDFGRTWKVELVDYH